MKFRKKKILHRLFPNVMVKCTKIKNLNSKICEMLKV